MITSLHELLRKAGWLPAQSDEPLKLVSDGNLLAEIASHWQIPDGLGPSRGRGQTESRFLARLERHVAAGAWLTLDLPPMLKLPSLTVRHGNANASSVGSRLGWWSYGVPVGRWLAIVSSRVGRKLDRRPEWLAVVRTACAKVEDEQAVLLAGAGTTTARLMERAAARFGLRSLLVDEPLPGETLTRWLNRMLDGPTERPTDHLHRVYLSPLLKSDEQEQPSADVPAPLCDRAVVAWADQLFVAHLRRGGNLERLVRDRLANRRWVGSNRVSPSVLLALGKNLVPTELAEELQGLGAVGWILLPPWDRAGDSESVVVSAAMRVPGRNSDLVVAEPLRAAEFLGAASYLTHCTRGPAGEWPDQTEAEYLDELLDARPPTERSALQSLVRILEKQRILGSASGLRGGTPAVCFTAVPLGDLKPLRNYQPQRKCWNFEPYGICIRREWLIEQGAREVIYGDDATWWILPDSERPFFQRRGTGPRTHGGTHRDRASQDWTREREWRLLGDVDLTFLPRSAAVVFVASVHEIERVAQVSRWPVTVAP